MAKKTIEKYYSDVSGSEIEGDYAPLAFAFDGSSYEIDLTDAEKQEFAMMIQQYVDAARSLSRRASTRKKPSGYDPKVVRTWAQENNVEVPARGRIPASVVEAYNAAN